MTESGDSNVFFRLAGEVISFLGEVGGSDFAFVVDVLVISFATDSLPFLTESKDASFSFSRFRFLDSNSRFFALSLANTGLSIASVKLDLEGAAGVGAAGAGAAGDADDLVGACDLNDGKLDGSFVFRGPVDETGIVLPSLVSSTSSGKSDTLRPHFSMNASYLKVAISSSR